MDEDGCKGCGGANRVMWMLTHLSPPQTIQACEEDVDMAMIAIIATRHEVDAGWLASKIDAALAEAVAEAEAEANPPAKPARRTKGKGEPTPIPVQEVDDLAVEAG